MARLMDNPDMISGSIPGLTGYQFSGVRPDRLGASEYTLVTLMVDISGSVTPFLQELIDSLKMTIEACRKSPRAGNFLIRVVTFSSGIQEVHGFKPLQDIDVTEYDKITTYGSTVLYDACASGIGAMIEYAKNLTAQDFGVNGVLYLMTDGDNNGSTFTQTTVKEKIQEAITGEVLESFYAILIGINTKQFEQSLMAFQTFTGMTAYIDAGKATPGNLAKTASFISRSVSVVSSSQGSDVSATAFTF